MTDAALHDPRAATLALIDRLRRKGHDLLRQFTPNAQSQLSAVRACRAEARRGQSSEGRVLRGTSRCASGRTTAPPPSTSCLAGARRTGFHVPTAGRCSCDRRAAKRWSRLTSPRSSFECSTSSNRRAARSPAWTGSPPRVPAPSDAPTPHRFDFVHDARLRPVLEQAFADGTRAFEAGDFEQAMMTACGMIEAIITDALAGPPEGGPHDLPAVRGVRLQPDLLTRCRSTNASPRQKPPGSFAAAARGSRLSRAPTGTPTRTPRFPNTTRRSPVRCFVSSCAILIRAADF